MLVSVWSSVDQDILGKVLKKYLDCGTNIVIILFSNCLNYTYPKGTFEFPLEIKSNDSNHQEWKKIDPSHPLF